jgi:hypothetical protein
MSWSVFHLLADNGTVWHENQFCDQMISRTKESAMLPFKILKTGVFKFYWFAKFTVGSELQ